MIQCILSRGWNSSTDSNGVKRYLAFHRVMKSFWRKRMKMKTAYQSALEGLSSINEQLLSVINLTPKVYLLVVDGKYVEAYASKETAEYEMHLCMQADDELDEHHVYRIREMDINFNTL